MVWQPGRQLQKGKYTVRDVLGVGRLGVTYRAETPSGKSVVIKTPNDEAMQRSDFDRLQEVFVREAFKLARCRHPHIVQAEEPFQEDGIWCIPMEYIAGTTLAKRDVQILPEAEAVRYVRQIGEALTIVHQNDLFHRDVNPTNIMLRIRDGASEAVLIDFGLARSFDQDLTQTRTEEISPGFTPLELYSRQAERGAYTDIYSLGATLYNLLTGKVPPSAPDRKLSHVKLLFPDKIPQPVKRSIQWAMELEAKDRPQSMQDWLEVLGQERQPESVSLVKSPVKAEPTKRFENWQITIGLVTAIAAVLASLSWLPALISALKPTPAATPSPTQTSKP